MYIVKDFLPNVKYFLLFRATHGGLFSFSLWGFTLRDIKDRSVLKIHETDSDQPQKVRERQEVRGRTVQMPVSRPHSRQAYGELPVGHDAVGVFKIIMWIIFDYTEISNHIIVSKKYLHSLVIKINCINLFTFMWKCIHKYFALNHDTQPSVPVC